MATFLLAVGGIVVALLSSPPLLYNESSSLVTGILISLAVGVAAGLATADDVGRREMIGLAATAQVAIIPIWFGVCVIFGFPRIDNHPTRRALALLFNVIAIIAASSLTYEALKMKSAKTSTG